MNSGYHAKDTIRINKKFSASKVNIDLVTGFSNRDANNAHGSIGFGFSQYQSNLISRLKFEKKIKRAVFSYYKNEQTQYLTLGDYEPYFADGGFTTYSQDQNYEAW